jgi:cellobiose phosphorylase
MAADVYAAPQHAGRGGWTWYTGAAAWMYRLIIESFLGLRLEVDRLHCTPCIPADWDGFTVHYRFQETVYHIEVRQSHENTEAASVSVDGLEQLNGTIPLVNDRRDHAVVVRIHAMPPTPAEQPPAQNGSGLTVSD